MLSLVFRLGLLLLLACDFWFEPHNGISPLAQPVRSTPAICQALSHRDTLQRTILASPEDPAWSGWWVTSASIASSLEPAQCPREGCASFLGSLLLTTSLHCFFVRAQI